MNIKLPQNRKGNFLNTTDLSKMLAEKLGISSLYIEQVLREMEDLIVEILLKDHNISFKFGKLCGKKFKARKAYDVVNDKHFMTKPRKIIKFYESTILRSILKGKEDGKKYTSA